MTAEADRLRGHAFLPDEGELRRVPPLYATERTPLAEKTVWLRYFAGAGCEWLVMEYDPAEGIAFGWADLGDPQNAELGYFSLVELRGFLVRRPDGLPVVVERDLHWEAVRFQQRPSGVPRR